MRPKTVKMVAKMTIARRKFAIGPAATMAARWPTRLAGKLTARAAGSMRATASLSGTLAAFSSPKKRT